MLLALTPCNLLRECRSNKYLPKTISLTQTQILNRKHLLQNRAFVLCVKVKNEDQ